MATDAFIELPPDSSGKKVRMVDPGLGTSELQEIVTIADSDGLMLEFVDTDHLVLAQLMAMNEKFDILIALLGG
jgi:hypothetical protein